LRAHIRNETNAHRCVGEENYFVMPTAMKPTPSPYPISSWYKNKNSRSYVNNLESTVGHDINHSLALKIAATVLFYFAALAAEL